MAHKYLAIDTETKGLDARWNPDVGFHFATVATSPQNGRVVELDELQPVIDQALSEGRKLVFHNASFDVPTLRVRGINIEPSTYDDTMLMSYVLEPGGEHSLDAWGEKLGLAKLEFTEYEVRSKRMEEYGIRDVNLTALTYEYLSNAMSEAQDVYEFYNLLVLPYAEVIMEMESTGLYIDQAKLPEVRAFYQGQMSEALAAIHKLVPYIPGQTYEYSRIGFKTTQPTDVVRRWFGDDAFDFLSATSSTVHPMVPKPGNKTQTVLYDRCDLDWNGFNPNSGDHIAQVLISYGWQPTVFSDKTNKPLTNSSVLEELDYPIITHLESFSDAHKVESTFLKAWDNKSDEYGFVHGQYNQAIALTGRLTSSNP